MFRHFLVCSTSFISSLDQPEEKTVSLKKCENGVRIAFIPPYSSQKDQEDKDKVIPISVTVLAVQAIFQISSFSCT
ncbi:MAG: hypothetical protein ACOYJZ_06015 [Acutalibacter sp.]|jgi:hypothetical protein